MTFLTDVRHTGSHSGHGILEAVTFPFRFVVRLVKRYSEYAAAEAQLNALSDHALADIGLVRSQIHNRVWADFDLS